MEYGELLNKLEKPKGMVPIVMDTDTYNEIDDQFALAFALAMEDKFDLQAIYAAPFQNHHADTPALGMQRSYEEILHVLDMLDRRQYEKRTFRGSDRFLQDEHTPVESDAVRDLICRAMQRPCDKPLYVVAIAVLTNIASAILLKPEIIEHIVVVWHGGVALDWPDCRSFNAGQDIAATRVVMGSGVPMVLQPGRGVIDKLLTTGPELSHWLGGRNAFCDYMIAKTEREARYFTQRKVWSRPLFDVAALAWLLDGDGYMRDRIEHMPLISYDFSYNVDHRRHLMRYVYDVDRDAVLNILFERLASFPKKNEDKPRA